VPDRWEEYASARQDANAFTAEPVQQMRVETVARRCTGTVLDVGGGDGYPTAHYGWDAVMVDISPTRVARAVTEGVDARVGDATALDFTDGAFDTVVLGEICEHLDNPGPAITEAFRVARERVIITLPLYGWADPTHQWRISLDVCIDEDQRATEPTKGAQVVLTFQRGKCWPPGYEDTDPTWKEQFAS
jgi:SAM-dependent methyltransferase